MWKLQKLHDALVASGLVSKDMLSVYADQGIIGWLYNPGRQGYTLEYRCNILVREYSKEPHLLFLCLVSALAEIDPNPDKDHALSWESSILDRTQADIEIVVRFVEGYCYRDAEAGEAAQAELDGQPVVLHREEIPPLGDFARFALIRRHEHDDL